MSDRKPITLNYKLINNDVKASLISLLSTIEPDVEKPITVIISDKDIERTEKQHRFLCWKISWT